jgi:DNA modification methylase
MPAESVHCVVTSPPYWGLRDYGVGGQLGLEPTPEEYVANMVAVFREVRRVLRAEGTLWLNLGDSYAGSGPSGASYQSETTRRRAGGDGMDGAFRVSRRLAERGLTYAEKKPVAPPGLKPKDLVGIPWRVAFALQADGWYLRSDIIWSKPNPMPESVTDRPTKAHEYLFLLSKAARYYFDADAVREPLGEQSLSRMEGHQPPSVFRNAAKRGTPGVYHTNETQPSAEGAIAANPAGRNLRTVWTIATEPYPGAHFATFPRKLVEPCVKAGCPEGGTVLDPFAGSGTTLLVAQTLGRRGVGIDLNPEYLRQALERNAQTPLGLVG